jgi:hypothetical protein
MKKPIHTCQHYLLPPQNEAILVSPGGEITRVPMPKGSFKQSTLCQLLACESVKEESFCYGPTSVWYTLVSDSQAGVFKSGVTPPQGIPLNSAVSALLQEADAIFIEYAKALNKPQLGIESVYGSILIHIDNELPF